MSERPAEARRPVDLEAAAPGVSDADKIYAWHPPAAVSPRPNSVLLELETLTCESLAEA